MVILFILCSSSMQYENSNTEIVLLKTTLWDDVLSSTSIGTYFSLSRKATEYCHQYVMGVE